MSLSRALYPASIRHIAAGLFATVALSGCTASNGGGIGDSVSGGDANAVQPMVQRADGRPNILFVVFEDMSARIGSYGDEVAHTPVLDDLAGQSVQYSHAFTTAGVCAPSRSALITGVHQQALGTMHMRTRSEIPGLPSGGPIEYDAVPPAKVKAFPELLRQAGYYTSNNGKTDYQFGEPFTIWDDQDADHPWRGRPAGQPFFAMVNIYTTHESYMWPTDEPQDNKLLEAVRQRNLRDLAGKEKLTDPGDVIVPPWLPDTPVVRADIARHYDNIAFSERQLARLLADLEEDGLADNTIVVVTTDHGDGLPRMKRSVYDGGIAVPLFVRFPDGRLAGTQNDELVSFVDFAPTFLSLAGVKKPDFAQGRVFFGADREAAPDYVYAEMDRHDAVVDRQRAVRGQRWAYIRNYQPDHAFFRPLLFRDLLPTMQEIWRVAGDDSAPPALLPYLAATRPAEELYDTNADPYEIDNLAHDPAYAKQLHRMRAAHLAFMEKVGDLASLSELEMVRLMWPGLEQPVTADPEIAFDSGRLILTAPTQGSSIGYRLSGATGPWTVYSGPILLKPGTSVEAKAIRYGFAESSSVHASAPSR